MSLPPFVEYPGNIVYKQPFYLNNTQIYGFTITGNMQSIQTMIDARLNFMTNRPNQKYFAASDKILLAFTNSPCGQSTTDDINKGMFTEITFMAYTVVADCHLNDKGDWVADRLLLMIPYIIVDTPFSMTGGRENYGFPKSFGQFVMPNDPAFVNNLAVYTMGIKKFNEAASTFVQPFVTVSREVDGQSSNGDSINSKVDFGKHLAQIMKPNMQSFHIDLGFLWQELKDMVNLRIPMVFLKQFRDVADASKACYQAVIEADGYLKGFHSASILSGKYEMLLNRMDTHPMDLDLGISSVNQIGHAFRVDCDLYFDNGKEVWRGV